MVSKLKESYKSSPNVKIISDFNEIINIKFDHIYSKDVLEHVRYINEHLKILYYLGNNNCSYNILIDDASSDGHVLNLYPDTVLKTGFWTGEIE